MKAVITVIGHDTVGILSDNLRGYPGDTVGILHKVS